MSASAQFMVADAFSDVPFGGNAAAVVLLGPGASFPNDDWLAKLAIELNQSNTAFISRRDDGGFALRWFTATGREAALAGHATIATAHSIWALGAAPQAELLRFHTRGGVVTCGVHADSEQGLFTTPLVACDFPAIATAELGMQTDMAETVRIALGPGAPLPIYIGRATEISDIVIVLESPDAVRSLQPNMQTLATLSERGVIVTAAARGALWAQGADFVSRWFAPAVGIPEDAVTGSSHCALAPFWSARLGKTDLVGYQCSARGGRVMMRCDAASGRVALIGRCVITLQGQVMVPLPPPSTAMMAQ